ncbi:MAG: GNAT family N-acetyltransferase [Methanomicrobiaceae archaeon]|nr:GNAT family N-acetyltransferase [Methanomicrobiaceae archaeon]
MKSDDAWFWHTSEWLEYTLKLRPDLKTKQKSFLIMNNGDIAGICPLLLNDVEVDGTIVRYFSFDRYSGINPALKNEISKKERERILKNIFSIIDSLAEENDVALCLMRRATLSGSYRTSGSYNYLERFGFLNSSLSTCIIDLSKDENALLSDMRKGHRYNIRKGMDYYTVDIFDKNNITRDIFDQYQALHHKASGRVTRPQITFDLMYGMIKSGTAILAGLSYKGQYIGLTLVNIYKDGAFYSSAADDPEAEVPVPLQPLLQWRIMQWLKGSGIRYYETGLQQFGDQLYDYPSEKDLSISFFKRGFGGDIVPVFSGEKFYDKEFLKKTFENRIIRYLNP